MLAQTHCTLAVFGDDSEEVDGAADRGESGEPKAEGVSPDVLGGVAGYHTEGSDGHTKVAEANLEGGTNAASQVPADF